MNRVPSPNVLIPQKNYRTQSDTLKDFEMNEKYQMIHKYDFVSEIRV